MQEIKIEKGLIKYNKRCLAVCSGAFVLMGLGVSTGMISDQENIINYFAGSLLGINSLICAKMSYDCHKTLKKIN